MHYIPLIVHLTNEGMTYLLEFGRLEERVERFMHSPPVYS